jgi:hypothetical protein
MAAPVFPRHPAISTLSAHTESTMPQLIRLYRPTAPSFSQRQHESRVLSSLQGAVVGFIDNTKPNFAQLVDDLADLMTTRLGVRSTIKRQKRASSVPAPESYIAELAAQCDLVITGSGD